MRLNHTSFLALAAACLIAPYGAHAAGCIKGAAVGGVAGHVAGGHGVVGAVAGCAIEHHREKKAKANAAKPAPAAAPAASTPAT